MQSVDERRVRFADRRQWLESNIVGLRLGMKRAPLLLLGLLTLPLIGWRWGFAAAGLVAFLVITLSGATLYVAWSHIQEYEGELAVLKGKIKALDEPPAA